MQTVGQHEIFTLPSGETAHFPLDDSLSASECINCRCIIIFVVRSSRQSENYKNLVAKNEDITYTKMYREAREENVRHDIREHIKSDAVNKQVNPEKQGRHDVSSKYYVKGRSYLLPGVDAQQLVDRYHGTGEVRLNRTGDKWINKEFVAADKDIGVNVNPATGIETVTNRFTIHYSNTGTHVVPTERRERAQ